MVKKELYLKLRKRILDNSDVVHCQLYNSQFDNMELENTFRFPCAFIEYSNIDYITKGKGHQEGMVTISIHVGVESLIKENLSIFDILQDIHEDIQGFDDENFNPLVRVSERQDINHDNVVVWIVDYTTLIADCSAHTSKKKTKTTLNEVDIEIDTSTEMTKPRLKHL